MLHSEDPFKKHSKFLYYAKILHVAQALFEQGARDSSVASGLLVPIANVKAWRDLFQKGELLKNRPQEEDLENRYSSHDLKHLAKAFFDMGLRCRPVSLYLNLPLSTVYSWHRTNRGG